MLIPEYKLLRSNCTTISRVLGIFFSKDKQAKKLQYFGFRDFPAVFLQVSLSSLLANATECVVCCSFASYPKSANLRCAPNPFYSVTKVDFTLRVKQAVLCLPPSTVSMPYPLCLWRTWPGNGPRFVSHAPFLYSPFPVFGEFQFQNASVVSRWDHLRPRYL